MLVAQVKNNTTSSLSIEDITPPELPDGGAIIRMTACGLCGSDLDKLINNKAKPGTVLGHEVVGIIEILSDGHNSHFQVGDRIITSHHVPCGGCHDCINDHESMCRQFKSTNLSPGGFSHKIAITKGHLHNTAFKIPDHISDSAASCIEPLSCVVRAVRRSPEVQNGKALVVGLGFIGAMAAQCYQNKGMTVLGCDLSNERITLCKENSFISDGFIAGKPSAQGPFQGVDIVFLSVVNPKTVKTALDSVRDGGTIIVFTSETKGQPVNFDANALYFREISVITSYSPSLFDLKEAAENIFSDKILVNPLISHEKPLAEVNEAIALYKSGEAMKVVLTP